MTSNLKARGYGQFAAYETPGAVRQGALDVGRCFGRILAGSLTMARSLQRLRGLVIGLQATKAGHGGSVNMILSAGPVEL